MPPAQSEALRCPIHEHSLSRNEARQNPSGDFWVAVDRVFRAQLWGNGGDDAQQDNLWECSMWHEDIDSTAFGVMGSETDAVRSIHGRAAAQEAILDRAAVVGFMVSERDA